MPVVPPGLVGCPWTPAAHDLRGLLLDVAAEAVSAIALVAVLAWAIVRPRGWPEAVAAVPAAAVVVAAGAISPNAALAEAARLAPVAGFLAAVLVLAQLCDDEGLFQTCGAWMAVRATGRPRRLLGLVFLVAAATTAVLGLDATVVLLTPVVFVTAGRARARPKPHVYACTHLANSASLLLPVSNLTNLLAFAAAGLAFPRFAALMALPWLTAVATEYLVFRRFFAGDLNAGAPAEADAGTEAGAGAEAGPGTEAEAGAGPGTETGPDPGTETGRDLDEGSQARRSSPGTPAFALVVLAATLAGFVGASLAGVNPAWAAFAGAAVLAVRALARHATTPAAIARSADLPFLLFVLALGVIVRALITGGLGSALGPLVPHGASLPALLAVAVIAAALANLVNNLPAVLVMIPLAAPAGAGAILAVLVGVNIGPNLTYTGSLATLLWRRVLHQHGSGPALREFTTLGLLSVPAGLVLSVLALWGALHIIGG